MSAVADMVRCKMRLTSRQRVIVASGGRWWTCVTESDPLFLIWNANLIEVRRHPTSHRAHYRLTAAGVALKKKINGAKP